MGAKGGRIFAADALESKAKIRAASVTSPRWIWQKGLYVCGRDSHTNRGGSAPKKARVHVAVWGYVEAGPMQVFQKLLVKS